MFAKLLKQEWRATRKVIGLLCVIILLSGATIGIVAHHLALTEQSMGGIQQMSEFESCACVVLVLLGVMAVAVCCAGSVFCVLQRFYRSRFTDEGYLTFTLPVSSHQLLLSSLVNSIFCIALVLLVCVVAMVLVLGLLVMAFPQNILWGDLWVSWAQYRTQLWDSFREIADMLALLGFSLVSGGISRLMLLMLAVTIGAIVAAKHKIFTAVLVYCGIGLIQGILSVRLAAGSESLAGFLSLPGITSLLTAIVTYFLLHYLITRKLDLP